MKEQHQFSIYFVSLLVLSIFLTACAPKPESMLVGKWTANLGDLMLWGEVTETIEFFEDGTVVSQTELTNFIGNYRFIADDTIRIDWKEQGAFGHSPSEILTVKRDGDKLLLTKNNGETIEYTSYATVQATIEAAPQLDESVLTGSWELFSEFADPNTPPARIVVLQLDGNGTALLSVFDGNRNFINSRQGSWGFERPNRFSVNMEPLVEFGTVFSGSFTLGWDGERLKMFFEPEGHLGFEWVKAKS